MARREKISKGRQRLGVVETHLDAVETRRRVGVKRQAMAVRPRDALLPALRGRAIRPVSYTHLRAHETVLDLVCRLLLEKKKHTA